MRRPAVILAAVMALAMSAAGCGDEGEARAFAAFQELIARPDLRYRLEASSRSEGGGASSQVQAVVVGRDSTMSVGTPGEARTFGTILVGDRQFARDFGGSWTESPRAPGQMDIALVVTTLARSVEPAGASASDGRKLYRLVSRAPFSLDGSGGGGTEVAAAEFLIDEAGLPVRAVVETRTGGVEGSRAVTELLFRDVGGDLSVEPPGVR